MRLLYFQGNGTLAFTDFGRQKPPPYAILSHTWAEEEMTFQDLTYGAFNNVAGSRKIAFCGQQAAKDGLDYFWVDTCSIDKSNLPELTRSINSMFRWYRNASKCYVYLADVSVPEYGKETFDESAFMEAFRESRWFTRGWTLQELLAPKSVEFFSKEGHFLGDKISLQSAITEITGIPADALQGRSLSEFSVDERFAWADQRETSEEEDIAYCLLGIFDVFMPLIYGEGEANAMKRLERLVEESLNEKALGGNAYSSTEPGERSESTTNKSKRRTETKDPKATARMKEYLLAKLGSHQALTIPHKLYRDANAQVVLNHWHRARALPRELAQGANAGSIFQDAHVSFLNSVFWDEWPAFETYGSPEEMMRDIQRHCENATHSSQLLIACKSISAFSVRWMHFFDVVELAMTIDPEWPRTLWGAVRLVFVRCKDFVNMFKKLANMFERLKDRLPSYHDHVLRLRNDCPEAAKTDLCKALAIVYADVLQFCQDACTMFQTSADVSCSEADPVQSLTFVPFTVAFEDLLERTKEHKRLFDIGLRTGKHDELQAFIGRVIKALLEREDFFQDTEVRRILQRDRSIQDRIFYDNLRKWIQSPDYKSDYGKARDARSASTGDWLQTDSAYVAWKTEMQKPISRSGKRENTAGKQPKPILWLEGPPGFGKTVLSTIIIEDLQESATRYPNAANGPTRNAVAYFYFNAQLSGKQTCVDALRGIALQIIDALEAEPGTTDVLSLSLFETNGSRTAATFEDLTELIRLCVRRLSSLALILDGIDESQDFEEIWPFLGLACGDQQFKCLCLARPSITIPIRQARHVQRHSLHGKNGRDIWKYLREETQALQQAGHLSEDLHVDYIADTLSSRADSRFLWANLIISYVRSPSLGPSERLKVIEDPGQLQSLHGLFAGILHQYQALFFEDRNLLTKVLQFLVLSREPLSVDQLNILVSTKPGRKLERADLLPDFSETLKKLCGSLIEVTDSAVLFSHLSFRAFLESEEAIDLKSSFRVDKKAGSLQFAVVCLSYLIHHIPQGPLSGSHETAANREDVEQQFPLAKYSARHWVDHAVATLELMPGSPRELVMACYHLLQQLGSFVSQKASVSAWIELCWTCHFPASIEPLWLEFEQRVAQNKISAQKGTMEWRIFQSLDRIRGLSEDLKRLNEHWSHLLLLRPYEIWGPSISVFLGPVSWAHNKEASITVVNSDETDEILDETIIKVSKLSSCGKFIGVVRLSKSVRHSETKEPNSCNCGRKTCICNHETSPVDLHDAVATYQILELKDGFPIASQVSIPLDPEDLREVERTAEGSKFRFPIAFAPNLQSISILHTIYYVEHDGSLQQQRLSQLFVQDLSSHDKPQHGDTVQEQGKQSTMRERLGKRQRLVRKFSNLRSFKVESPKPGTSKLETSKAEASSKKASMKTPLYQAYNSEYYRFIFSPCGQYVAHLERQQDMNESALGRWDIVVWKCEHQGLSGSVSRIRTWKKEAMLLNIYSDFTRAGTLAFNPQFLQIGLFEHTTDSPDEISVWNFGGSGKARFPHRKTTMIYATGLQNIHFSVCGRYLFGDHPVFMNPRIVELEQYLHNAVPVPVRPPEPQDDAQSLDVEADMSMDVEMVEASEESYTHVVQSTSTRLILAHGLRQPVLSSNELALVAHNGIPELTIVRRHGGGDVLLKRLSAIHDTSETLLYLPKDLGSRTAVSVLDDRQSNQETVRMVLTNDFQDSYTWDDPQNRQSASIITRSATSIKTIQNGAGEISSMPNSSAQRLLMSEEDSDWLPFMEIN